MSDATLDTGGCYTGGSDSSAGHFGGSDVAKLSCHSPSIGSASSDITSLSSSPRIFLGHRAVGSFCILYIDRVSPRCCLVLLNAEISAGATVSAQKHLYQGKSLEKVFSF